MAVGAASVMSPASLFVTAASRSARRVVASSSASSSSTAASSSFCGGGYSARAVAQLGGNVATPIRSGGGAWVCRSHRVASSPSFSSCSSSAGRRAFLRGVAARAAESPLTSDIDIGEDSYPRLPPSVHSLHGDLAILQGVGGDVQPGTLLKLGTSGVTGILLSHREPKSFALLYTSGAGEGGAPAVGATHGTAAAQLAAGDAVEVVRSTADKSTSKKNKVPANNRFRMPGEADVKGRWLGALGQPLDGGDAPGGRDRDVTRGEGSELLREPPSVEDRKPITTPLITGKDERHRSFSPENLAVVVNRVRRLSPLVSTLTMNRS